MFPALRGIPIDNVVPDAQKAARRHSAIFGSGPHFYAEFIPLRFARWTGEETVFNYDLAVSQWGHITMELMEPRDQPGPAPWAVFVEKPSEMAAELG